MEIWKSKPIFTALHKLGLYYTCVLFALWKCDYLKEEQEKY